MRQMKTEDDRKCVPGGCSCPDLLWQKTVELLCKHALLNVNILKFVFGGFFYIRGLPKRGHSYIILLCNRLKAVYIDFHIGL